MKILFGMPAKDSWGGPAACEPPFVDALRDLGVDVATETYVYGDKEESTSFISRVWRVVRTALRFRKRLRDENFDLIHLNSAFDKRTLLRDTVSVALMGRRRPKVFLKIHGAGADQIRPKSFFYKRLIKFLDGRVDGYGVFTREELATFGPHGLNAAKFHIIKNVVQLEPSPSNQRLQKEPSDEFELIFVSRFIESKGLIETIRAAAILEKKGNALLLKCIGDGPQRNEAAELVKELGLADLVSFTGYIPEPEVTKQLISADIFVFPTRHNEGFPIALFKAALAGLPIVTTRVRAAAEYMTEPENCLFCTGDPTDIASRIEQLIDNKPLRESMSAANMKFADPLAPKNVAAEYLKIYSEILG